MYEGCAEADSRHLGLSSGSGSTRKGRMRVAGVASVMGLLLGSLVLTSSADAYYKVDTTWASSGSSNGQLLDPRGLAVDSTGATDFLYVADTTNNRVQKFDTVGNWFWARGGDWTGTPCGIFITPGCVGRRDGDFYKPEDVATDAAGNLYVADSQNGRIQKFAPDGTFLTKWEIKIGSSTQFAHSVDVAPDGSVYVLDRGLCMIWKYNSIGTFITRWGGCGFDAGQMSRPSSIATDLVGNVYVADTDNRRVVKFNPTGTPLTTWGGLINPEGIEIDGDGFVYVADTDRHQIQKFLFDGTRVADWGERGSGFGQFERPIGLAADDTGHVYVTDENDRITKFAVSPPDTEIIAGADPITGPEPTFGFQAAYPGAAPGYDSYSTPQFQCSIDQGTPSYSACSPGQSFGPLTGGDYTFRVRALDTDGTDPTPATHDFTVDDTLPIAFFFDGDFGGPSGPTGDNTLNLPLLLNEPGATFQCEVFPRTFSFSDCGSPHTVAPPASRWRLHLSCCQGGRSRRQPWLRGGSHVQGRHRSTAGGDGRRPLWPDQRLDAHLHVLEPGCGRRPF